MLKKAREAKVYVRHYLNDQTFEYHINQYDADKMDKFIAQADALIAANNAKDAAAMLQKLKETDVPVMQPKVLVKDGKIDNDVADLVMDDIIIESVGNYELIVQQFALLEKYNAMIARLEAFINGAGEQEVLYAAFERALSVGIISRGTNRFEINITTEGEFGFEETKALTTIDSMPFGEDIPLYSAFVAFGQLGKEQIDKISQSCRTKRATMSDEEMEAAQTAAKEMFSPEQLTNMKKIAVVKFQDDANSIIQFMQKVSSLINLH